MPTTNRLTFLSPDAMTPQARRRLQRQASKGHVAIIEDRPRVRVTIDCRECFGDPAPIAHQIHAAPDVAEALQCLLDLYCRVVHSGDCGFWDPEEDPEVIKARAALAKARGEGR